jgi:hypothetical protein
VGSRASEADARHNGIAQRSPREQDERIIREIEG